jgi:uncharacterized protein (DUF697 family)
MPPDPTVERTIRRTSFATAAIAIVLSPIPLADELLMLPIYALLTTSIARSRGLARKQIPWRPIVSTATAGLGARAVVNVTVSYIPGVAALANAATAVALTELFGRYVDSACAEPDQARPLTPKQILAALQERVKNTNWRAPWKRRKPDVTEVTPAGAATA